MPNKPSSNNNTPGGGSRTNLVKALTVLAVAAALTVGGVFALRGQRTPAPTGTPAKASGTMTLGRDDAPITVIEYSDFQCPFCGIFAREIQPQLIEQYVDTGLVRFEWRNFPIFGQFSYEAALGTYCANEQQAFWPYHDAVYNAVGDLGPAEKNIDTLVDMAAALELDVAQFRACIEEGKYDAQVRQDFEEGRALNIVGTPSFTVNGVLLVGAQPMDTWHRVFEAFSE